MSSTSHHPQDFGRINAAALGRFDAVMTHLRLGGGKTHGAEYLPVNPKRDDRKPGSFSINRDSGQWADFACGEKGGDLVSLAAYLLDLRQTEAAQRMAEFLGMDSKTAKPQPTKPQRRTDDGDWIAPIPDDAPPAPKAHPRHGRPSQTWTYRDVEGHPLFFNARFDFPNTDRRKEFAPLTLWRTAGGRSEWRWKAPPAPRALYGLPSLAEYPDKPVVLAEGEKSTDATAHLFPDLPCVTWCGGAEAVAKADFSGLVGREVWVWPDHDPAGEKAAEKLMKVLAAAGARPKQINLTNFGQNPTTAADGSPTFSGRRALDPGDDAADLLARGWTAQHIAQLRTIPDFYIHRPNSEAPKQDQQHKKPNGKAHQDDKLVLPPRFEVKLDNKKRGLYVNEVRHGNLLPPRWVCPPLEIPALLRDPAQRAWSLLVEFHDPDKTQHRVVIPDTALRGDGIEAIALFMDRGFVPNRGCDGYLVEYLRQQNLVLEASPKKRARVTNRCGWHGEPAEAVFVLPSGAIGASTEEWIFESDSPGAQSYRARGTLEGWREQVSALCVGNSRLLFTVSSAFAAPLLYLGGFESGGFHYVGDSSLGKTTLLRVAASACGSPATYLQRWRATDNGLEAVALQHCDAPLLLDELAQLDPRVAGEVAYMLANGSGKQRAARTGLMRERASWRLLFASSGEIGLAQHMATAGKTARAGQETRLCDVPANAGAGSFGCFESLHGFANGSDFAKALDQKACKDYGTAFPAFLERLVREREDISGWLHDGVHRFERAHLTEAAAGQARRVAARFAVIGLAGELATGYGITGWQKGTALAAAGTCFRAWLEHRGGEGNQEERAMLAQVREFVERHGEGRFADWGRPVTKDDHAPKVQNKAGFRKHNPTEDKTEWFIYPHVFRAEVCRGLDAAAVAHLLIARNFLRTDKDHSTHAVRLPGEGRQRMYHVLPALMEAPEGSGDKGQDDDA